MKSLAAIVSSTSKLAAAAKAARALGTRISSGRALAGHAARVKLPVLNADVVRKAASQLAPYDGQSCLQQAYAFSWLTAKCQSPLIRMYPGVSGGSINVDGKDYETHAVALFSDEQDRRMVFCPALPRRDCVMPLERYLRTHVAKSAEAYAGIVDATADTRLFQAENRPLLESALPGNEEFALHCADNATLYDRAASDTGAGPTDL